MMRQRTLRKQTMPSLQAQDSDLETKILLIHLFNSFIRGKGKHIQTDSEAIVDLCVRFILHTSCRKYKYINTDENIV